MEIGLRQRRPSGIYAQHMLSCLTKQRNTLGIVKQALMAGPHIYQVTSNEKPYSVNLQQRRCGCRKWHMTRAPCNHAVSAITKAKERPEDFVHDFFKKLMYLAAY